MTAAFVACLILAHPDLLSVRVDAGIRHEPGVETRVLLSPMVRYQALPQLDFSGQVTFSGLDNSGLAGYRLGMHLKPVRLVPIAFEFELAHQEWSDWLTGENRICGIVTAEPSSDLRLGAGAAWRVPLAGRDRWNSPLNWHGDMPEWNLAYLIRWRLLTTQTWDLTAFLTNIDSYGMDTPQQFPFGLESAYRVSSRLLVQTRMTASIKGLSGPLGSLGALTAGVGVCGDL